MKFSSSLLRGLALSGLLFSYPSFANSHSDESSIASDRESHAASVASAEESVMDEMGELARTRLRIRKLDRLLHCAAALVEHQFNGAESAMKGLDFMATAMDRIGNENYRYKDLTRQCRSDLFQYRKSVRKNRISQKVMSEKENQQYMAQVESKYGETKPGLVRVAQKGLNANFQCRKATGFDVKVGAILSVGLGWDHYTCRSPLGRKYHVSGPTVGLGVGLGANVDVNVVDPTKFSFPINSCMFGAVRDQARSNAFILGMGKTTATNDEQKSTDLSLGLGANKTKRGMVTVRVKRRPDFTSTGVYRDLGLTEDINL